MSKDQLPKVPDDTYHKRLRHFEAYDKIVIEQRPRFKTSGLSGDEWRTGVVVQLWFKGQMIVEEFYNSYDFAIVSLVGPAVVCVFSSYVHIDCTSFASIANSLSFTSWYRSL